MVAFNIIANFKHLGKNKFKNDLRFGSWVRWKVIAAGFAIVPYMEQIFLSFRNLMRSTLKITEYIDSVG